MGGGGGVEEGRGFTQVWRKKGKNEKVLAGDQRRAS